MREDRLRALRAIRFAARFGFTIDPATRSAIENSAPYLGRLSPERVKQELDKTMEQVARPRVALKTWRSTGAFATLVPALASASDAELEVADYLAMPGPKTRPARRALRFAGLLSALEGKEAAKVMVGLRSSKIEIQLVESMVGRWRKLGPTLSDALRQRVDPADADVRRWVATVGRLQVGSFMRLADAIWAAARAHGEPAPGESVIRALYRRMVRSAWNDAIDLGALAVDGDDLRSAGIAAGPALGRGLNELLEAVIDDPSQNTRDQLLRRAMGSGQRA
jgi:tRNA nucleotidyltransferase/poly(A) polymerase